MYQKAVRILEITQPTSQIAIDIFDKSATLGDVNAQVYVNHVKRNDISRVNINGVAYIKFSTPLSVGDHVIYKVQTTADKNARGYYEIPHNWQNNPFNETLGYFTLGEAIDHVRTIVENNPKFLGAFPGVSNLPSLGNVSKFGHRFLQHSGSFPLAAYLITDKRNNIIDALQWTATQYTQFKKEFLRIAGVSAFEGNISERVDQILLEFSKSKYIDRSPFYFSDIAPYKGFTQREYVVQDVRLPVFVIDSIFNPQAQTTRSVLVYVNEVQLVYLVDYNFSKTDAFVNILFPLHKNDRIVIKDYVSTNGSYIPYTPSALGLYPSYVPTIFIDDTYATPVKAIQGHDGSIIVAYNDYRDDLILELEKRIYNTRRVNYNSNIFNIHNVIGGYYRSNVTLAFYTRSEINNVLLPEFLKWNALIDQDYSSNYYFNPDSGFTYNYSNFFAPDGVTYLPGWWRAIYIYAYDTDRPHSHPWEMQGFTIKPVWWDTIYGKAPYTSENTVMWTAIEKGVINTPGYRRTESRYARLGLLKHLPVDADGNLLSPIDSNFVKDFSLINATGNFTFGDGAPVETAWRRSSEYPFSVIKAMCVLCGSEFIGKMWDRFTIKRNIAGQIYNSSTGKRFNTADIVYPNTPLGNPLDPNVSRSMSCGLANIIDDYVFSINAVTLDSYKEIISGLNIKLSHRIGAFTAKDKLNVLLDSRSPTASGTVFLPQENYQIFYNQSSPVASAVYSGVLVEKLSFQNKTENITSSGYKISGYDKKYGIFQIFQAIASKNDVAFNVGGVTDTFATWSPNQYYTKDFIVKYENVYYKAIVSNTSSESFTSDQNKWIKLSTLPITGGVSALKRTRFSDTSTTIPYGTVLPSIQAVVDFLLGYQEKLKSVGFKFDDFNKEIGTTLDWETSAKEFMFWSLQNWNSGAVITLSPSATNLQFNPVITASIDDFSSSAFEYSMLKADGTPLRLNAINIHRIENGFTAKPTNASDGIYFVRANLIQREHVLILDNESDFNDIVYDKVSGYRQGRVKLIGFKTSEWDGGYTTPGFMYDSAVINPWQPFVDYNLGDIVSYKNNNYVAIVNVSGSTDFDFINWKQQEKTLPAGLIPNWDYRVEQFRDFYDLNASIFDSNQKKLARHIIGYQDRPYLDNIIIDDVAQFKFYQGYIKEKGTFNSITKLFDVLRSSGFSTANLYEDWAFKVGNYGASAAYTEIEFPLDEMQFRHNPQDVVLTPDLEYQTDLSIYNVSSAMVPIKPFSYDSNPFPVQELDSTQSNYGIFKYQVAGYVRSDDVEHIIYNRAALLNYDITQLRSGDKIWLGYTENNDWDVLEYVSLDLTIKTWTVDFVTNSHIYLYCDTTLDLARGDIISISNLGLIDGSYIIQDVSDNIITIYTLSTLATIPNLVTSGVIHILKSVRYKNLKEVSTKIYNKFDIVGEKIWIDQEYDRSREDDLNQDLPNNWLVLENTDAFFNIDGTSKSDEILPYTKFRGQKYGYEVKISGDDLCMIVSAPFGDIRYQNLDKGKGSVIIYRRPNNLSSWSFSQILKIPRDYTIASATPPNEHFGVALAISNDGKMIAVGTAYASNLRSFYKGIFDEYTSYNKNDIIKYNDNQGNTFLFKAKVAVPGQGNSFIYDKWDLVDSYLGDPAGAPSGFDKQGIVTVFEYDDHIRKFVQSAVLGSYDPCDNEYFGFKLQFSTDIVTTDTLLFVSSKDYSYSPVVKTISRNIENSNILYLNSVTGIIPGQEANGVRDQVTGLNITPLVVSINTNNQTVIIDQYISVVSGTTVRFIMNRIGRVQVLRLINDTNPRWTFNSIQPFVALPTEHSLFPASAFTVISKSQYGYSFDCSSDLSTIVVSAPFLGAGVVYIFEITRQTYSSSVAILNGTKYYAFRLVQIINSDTLIDDNVNNLVGGYISAGDAFGFQLTLNANTLLVSAPNNSSRGTHNGALFNFERVNNVYQLQQVIIPPKTSTYAYERFGTTISVNPQGNVLTVGSKGGPSVLDTTFDSYVSGLYADQSVELISIEVVNNIDITSTYIQFNIPPQETPPIVDVFYTISGNLNEWFNGSFMATDSDQTTITFKFDYEPGEFIPGGTFASNPNLAYILDPNSDQNIPTTFDNNATKFYDQIPFTGAVYVYNRFDDNFIYADRLTPNDTLSANDDFGFSIFSSSNCVAIGTPNRLFAGESYGSVFIFNYNTTSWKRLREATPLVSIDKFKKSFYYNTATNKLIGNLDLYDPAKGRIPSIADQEIKYQTYYDPAVYQYNGDDALATNIDQVWTDNHVGEVWWDLSTIKYTWYEQGDATYRNLQWGQLFPGSVVNVYEWVESKYLPSKYVTLADTGPGLAAGISGTPKDTTDVTYSTKTKYDSISGIVTTLYYFWVSSRSIIPSFMNRKLSANDIANLISDPKGQGYRMVSITGKNSLSLTNVKPRLVGKDVSLNLQFYEVDNTELAVHREYVLITKGDEYTVIPELLENKWFDSLIGSDIVGNLVPDKKLSIRQRYGNSSSPRQSWFINKNEALKQNIEYINSVLQDYNLFDNVNLTNLKKQDTPPSLESGEIDVIIDTLEELVYVGTNGLRTTQISVVIKDGKLLDCYIDDSGYGYGKNRVYQSVEGTNGIEPILWYGPTCKIVSSTGSGGQIQTYIDSYGQVKIAEITKRGQGYNSILGATGTDIGTTVVVRDFTALVLSDSEANNNWSIHTWSFINDVEAEKYRVAVQNSLSLIKQNFLKNWLRIKTQSYNVTRYWKFVDWYASGYNSQSDIKYIINQSSDLIGLNSNVGDLIKITNSGLNSWLLMVKIANTGDPDFTIDYQVVGQESATIQFSSALYNYNSDVGYDENYSFDLDLYDSTPTTELRIILESIRDDIFVGNLKIEYINLFFNTIHYILSEQHFTDWFFKTSFLKMSQIVGNLNQNATFQTDPLADYESYIEEVKPYKTKIREFISSYQGYDYSYNTVSDFDLPGHYDIETKRLESVDQYSPYINTYPWANWLENHTYQVTEIVINQPGSGYIYRPVVVISPPIANAKAWIKTTPLDENVYISFNHNYYITTNAGITGTTPPTHTRGSRSNGTVTFTYVATDARASAYIASGLLFKIVLDNPGYGFLTSPIVTIRGGNSSIGFIPATATAFIGNSKVRSMTLKMKFDRYLKDYYVDNFRYTDTFQVTTLQSSFKLTYAPEIEKSKFAITVDDIEFYGSQFSISITQEIHDTYTSMVGTVVFSPAISGTQTASGAVKPATVVISYYKNIGIYGAADRINYAYSPTSGQYGKDLSQLMRGIDYGGVEFTSIAFDIVGGWDVMAWDINSWDTIVTMNDDYVIKFNNDSELTNDFMLPYTPEANDIINVYLTPDGQTSTIRIDASDYSKNYGIDLYGHPFHSITGVFEKTSSIVLNSLVYSATVSYPTRYNAVTDITTVYVNIFTSYGIETYYEYPQPLAGWVIDSTPIIADSIRHTYNTWSIKLQGNYELDFVVNSSYDLEPPESDHVVITDTESTLFNFEQDDFTIEFFVKPFKDPTAIDTPILFIGEDLPGKHIIIGQNINGNGVGFRVPFNDDTSDDYTGFSNIPLDEWTHLALVRKDSIVYFFIGGVLQETINPSIFDFVTSDTLILGTGLNEDDGFFRGSIGNLRILKGVGLYTVNFAVPALPLTNIANHTSLLVLNSETITHSFIGNGIENTVSLDLLGYLSPGDQLIFRKSTSDGTVLPNDQSLLDSLISGGDLVYSSARGIAPDEIIIDGDEFVSSDTAQGPEELIQGHIVDTVDIKVYDAPPTGGPKITISNYIGDGVTSSFAIATLPPTKDSVVIFVNRLYQTLIQVDFLNKIVSIVDEDGNPAPPALNSKIVIFIIDTAGYDILSREVFLGDGETVDFVTRARYTANNVSVYLLIDGIESSASVITSNIDNPNAGNVVVRLKEPPAVDSVVQIMVFRGVIQKYSKTNNEIIPVTTSKVYQLARVPGNALPLSAYVWVIVSYTVSGVKKQDFLRAPDYENFTYPQAIILDGLRYSSHTLELDAVNVYKNNVKLLQIRDYIFDNMNNQIHLTSGLAVDGDKIIVEILRDHDFEINDSTLIVTKNYNLSNKDSIILTTFTNHNQWDIVRENKEFTFINGYESVPYDITQYDTFGTSINTSGIFNLPRTVSDKSGVLVSISRELLTPDVDYVILDNMKQLKVILPDILTKEDYIEIITTNPKVSQNSFGFRIFKDMLNRTQYKRMDNKKTVILTKDLNYFDTTIEVDDGSILDLPNRNNNLPGVINVNFERIEYMVKTGNVLSQLRRGTLGTAINVLVTSGTPLTSMSYSDTVPYKDSEIKNTFIADTAIMENTGITLGTTSGIVYGTEMVAPDHAVTAIITINNIDISVDLESVYDGGISANRTIITNAINSYTNITGVSAERVVNIDHPAISNNTNGIDLVPTKINVSITGFVSITSNHPYLVTFSISTQLVPLAVGQIYSVSGSLNTDYNGKYVLVDSSVNEITLAYPDDPGTYVEKINISSFATKTGQGPYFVTFNIPAASIAPTTNIVYSIEGNINQKYNSSYYATDIIATSSTLSTITFRYPTDPGVYITDISVISKLTTEAMGPNNTGPYRVTYSIVPQTIIPNTDIYYNITGANNAINYSIQSEFQNTSFYNGLHRAVESTLNTITIEYLTDPGTFAGGYIRLGSLGKINSNTILNRDPPSTITVANSYILPLNYLPKVSESTVATDNSWYRETIPAEYGQNDEMEVFVNGIRLNKTPLLVYDQTLGQDSYEGAGDKQIEADYSVNGIDSAIRFTNAPAPGSNIKIVVKKGVIWYKLGETVPFAFSESRVAKFITSTSVDLPK